MDRFRKPPRRRAFWPLLLLALLPLLPSPAAAHLGLQRSTPAAGDTVRSVPSSIRLVFTQPVELAASRVVLVGPQGERPLEPLALAPDSPRVVLAGVDAPLVPGTYTVRWQVAGRDGHPIHGEFSFAIPDDATGVATPVMDPPNQAAATMPGRLDRPLLDTQSPLYATVRWGGFVALLSLIGAVAFRLLLLPRTAARIPELVHAAPAAARVGRWAVSLLLLMLLLRLWAQSLALFGAMEGGRVVAMLGATAWGRGWLLQTGGAVLALAGLLASRREGRGGWALAAVGALLLAFASGLSGHAMGVEELRAAALLADGLHVVGAGGWLGTLLLVLVVGVPAAMRLGAARRGEALAALVGAFSPLALGFAGLVVATGTFAAWLHLGSVDALWGSEYGRTLLGKLALLSVVFVTGFYNWRRVRPALGDVGAAKRLRRSATVELVAGLLVLAATAYLVVTPPPEEEAATADAPTRAP